MPDKGGNDASARDAAVSPGSALDHAWNWFKCHADQRISLFQFYVVVTGGLATAVGFLHQQHENLLCAGVSIFAAFVCFCFKRLDRRTSDLVRLAERAMASEQARLAAYTGDAHFNMARIAGEMTGRWSYTYTDVIQALLNASSILLLFFAAVSALESTHVAMMLHDWTVWNALH